MTRIALTTALVVALAAPAFANSQLEAALGVEPGVYTTGELIELRTAMEENDQTRVNFILSGGSDDQPVSRTAPGHIQLAAQLGVNPADFSFAQLVDLRAAEEQDDRATVAFIRGNGSDDAIFSTQGSGTANAQLAASLGVEPGVFTTGELIDLRTAEEQNDRARYNFILNQAR